MNIRKRNRIKKIMILAAVLSLLLCTPVFAAGEDIISSGFQVIYTLIAAVVSGFGSVLLLWGFLEWGISFNTQDGGAQSMAFKRIAGGLIIAVVPQLIPIILSAIGAS